MSAPAPAPPAVVVVPSPVPRDDDAHRKCGRMGAGHRAIVVVLLLLVIDARDLQKPEYCSSQP
jgi:hypothetical protein